MYKNKFNVHEIAAANLLPEKRKENMQTKQMETEYANQTCKPNWWWKSVN